MSIPMDSRDTASLATKRRLSRWPLVRVAEETGADLVVPTRLDRNEVETKQVLGAAVDSRVLRAGEIFVPLPGDNTDGHGFISEAEAHGAAASFYQRGRGAPGDREEGATLLLVDDPEIALQSWGAARRRAWSGISVGITGTNGKTTTKDFLALCLETKGMTQATEGNHNNHLGVPLTLTGLSDDHRYAVVEMGMNHRGEIERLAGWAKPTCGVITQVGPAHLEGLGSIEEVCRAKCEMAQVLPDDGFLVIPAGAELLEQILNEIDSKVRRIRFAIDGEADLVATNVTSLGAAGVTFRVDGYPLIRLRLAGAHNVKNALAALVCSRELGVTPESAARALAQAVAPPGRNQPLVVGGVVLLLDHYNANPDSTRAALDTLQRWPAKRRFAVLGEMKELGDFTEESHLEVGRAAVFVDRLFHVGEATVHVAQGAIAAGLKEERVRGFPSNAELADAVFGELEAGDVVLIKGSRGARLEEVADALIKKLKSSDSSPEKEV